MCWSPSIWAPACCSSCHSRIAACCGHNASVGFALVRCELAFLRPAPYTVRAALTSPIRTWPLSEPSFLMVLA